MIKKLIQYGDSSALIIDKPILELLNIEADASVEISTDGSNIRELLKNVSLDVPLWAQYIG